MLAHERETAGRLLVVGPGWLGDTVMALVRLREAYQLGDEILRSYSIWHRELDPSVRELPAFKQLVGSPR
mgnify:CR=1 FL=1